MRLPWLLALAVVAVIAAACGGGGGSSLAPGTSGNSGSGSGTTATAGPTAGASTTSTNKSVALSILIPKATTSSASNKRSPKYIPSNTQSLTLTLLSVNGAAQSGSTTQGPYNLSAPTPTNPNPNCTNVTNGVKCSFTVSAPIGNDIFTANTFSGTNATGPLGSGAIALSVTANASNTASLTLDGPVANVSLFSATNGVISNGNPSPQPTASYEPESVLRAPAPGTMLTASQAAALHAADVSSVTRTSNARRVPALVTSAPASRLFVIALDAAGNQIINPTTFDIPITLTLALNGTPGSTVTLGVAYSGLSAADSGTSSTSSDGGTVTVYSPTDQITLTLTGSATAFTPYAPSVSASYTPQGGSAQTTSPLVFSVAAYPATPIYGLNFTHTNSLVVGVPGDIFATVTNTGNAASSGTIYFFAEIDNATINGFDTTNTTFWNCSIDYSTTSYSFYYCSSNAGETIAAGSAAPPVAINVTAASTPSVYHYLDQNTDFTVDDVPLQVTASDTIPVSSASSPILSVNAVAEPAPTPMIYTNDQTGYLIGVSNIGQLPTTGTITLTNTLPTGFTYQSYSGTNWSCSPASGPSAGPITCTYSPILSANGYTPDLTLIESAGNTTAFTSITNAFTASGGGSPSVTANVTSSVLPALQFTGASFPNALFTAASASNASAVVDFGLLSGFPSGTITLQSFYTATGAGYQTPTIESASDTCYPTVIQSPNPIPSFQPLSIPYTANVNIVASGATNPCTISVTDGNGSTASLTIQAESSSITVNGKARRK